MTDRILVADDDPDVVSALQYLLSTEEYRVGIARDQKGVLACLRESEFDLLLMDLNYSRDTTSGREGLQLLAQVRELDANLPVVVMTAWGSVDTAVKAMQQGARDFIEKPWENERLLSIVANQLDLQKFERNTRRLQAEKSLLLEELNPNGEQPIVQSAVMRKLLQQLQQVAASDVNILLTGENGTGKSFLVRSIHEHSSRAEGSLISVNMGAISESLFESEMFGHTKGAFTDARNDRIGRFELADGGTLFLDEIGNTPYSQQAKLLRVIEDRRFEKVGSSRTQSTDFRLITATNSDLEQDVNDGRFRQDLLYRINTVTLHIPPLRERKEDILALANMFLCMQQERYGKSERQLSDCARRVLLAHHWPGNIRELAHVMERAVILSTGEEIDANALGIQSVDPENSGLDVSDAGVTLEEIERQVLLQRMTAHAGRGVEAARSLGLSKSAFYRHLKKHGIK